MKKNRNSFLLSGLICLVILLVRPGNILLAAETGTLEEAVAWGLTHSTDTLSLEEKIAQIQRELAKIETNLHWQVGLGAGLSANLTEENGGSKTGGTMGNTGKDQETASLTLTGTKLFRTGLALEPKLTLQKDLKADDDPELDFTFSVSQQLYPWVPSALEQKYYETLNTLKKAKAELDWKVTALKIEWLEGYLQLLRLQEQLKVAEAKYTLAADDFSLTQKRQEMGEAGEGQVLAARISLKQAEYEWKQAQNNFTTAKREWLLALGLPADYPIILDEDDAYFRQLKEEVNALVVREEDPATLFARVEAAHYQLAAKRIDQEQLEQLWAWSQASYQPKVTTGGSYDTTSKKLSLNLNLSYQLWDGGAKQLAAEEHEAQRAALEREIQNLRASLETELYNRLHTQELAELKVEEKRMALEKAQLEREVYRRQREAGFLSEKDWTNKELELTNAEIGYKSAQDQAFVNKLRLLQLIGML
ncbi:MAG TPA: TolC family protein [Capillibacterium sp.]